MWLMEMKSLKESLLLLHVIATDFQPQYVVSATCPSPDEKVKYLSYMSYTTYKNRLLLQHISEMKFCHSL